MVVRNDTETGLGRNERPKDRSEPISSNAALVQLRHKVTPGDFERRLAANAETDGYALLSVNWSDRCDAGARVS